MKTSDTINYQGIGSGEIIRNENGVIPKSLLKRGSIKGKKAVWIPELKAVIWVLPDADEVAVRDKYLKRKLDYEEVK